MRRSARVLTSLLLAVALVAGACSSDDDTGQEAASTEETTSTATPEAGESASASTAAPGTVGVGPENHVEFSTPDGVLLEGTVYGDGADGIVLAHMRGADRSTWAPFAEVAAANGFRVLAFDFRGYGGSDGETDTSLDVDLTAAIEHLRSEGVDSVVVMGASMGGTATINVASKLDLDGIVSLSAPAEFQGLPALDVAADVEEPTMLIAAADDQPYADAAESMAQIAPDPHLKVFDGGAHGTNLFSDHPDDLTAELLCFAADPSGLLLAELCFQEE